jgi:hypothetical protein
MARLTFLIPKKPIPENPKIYHITHVDITMSYLPYTAARFYLLQYLPNKKS